MLRPGRHTEKMTKDSNKTVFGLPRSEKAPSGEKSAFYGWLEAILGTHKLAHGLAHGISRLATSGSEGCVSGKQTPRRPDVGRSAPPFRPHDGAGPFLMCKIEEPTHTHRHTHTHKHQAHARAHTQAHAHKQGLTHAQAHAHACTHKTKHSHPTHLHTLDLQNWNAATATIPSLSSRHFTRFLVSVSPRQAGLKSFVSGK